MSSVTRKYGLHSLHLLQTPFMVPPLNGQEEREVSNKKCNTMSGEGVKKEAVETFLDDNSEFLDDYIRRKIHRSKLEQWLFRPDRKESLPSVISSPAIAGNTSASFISHIKRQRSRSFTPLRKLSASKFEESGLSTPIVVTDVDGQPSFLRSSPRNGGGLSPAVDHNRKASKASSYPKSIDRNQSLYLLLDEIFCERDASSIITKAGEGLKIMLQCDHVSVLLTNPDHPFSGILHTLDQDGIYSRRNSTSDRIMTGVITSRQILQSTNPDLSASGSVPISVCLTTPLVNSESNRVFGAWRVAATGQCGKTAFSIEEESILSIIVRFAGIALTSLAEKKEMRLELTRSEVFLELAHTVFGEQSRIEPTLRTILSNFLTMIECERCQILLTDSDDPMVFKRVFDLQRSDLNEEGEVRSDTVFEGRFPINAAITGEVASKGQKVNIKCMKNDDR